MGTALVSKSVLVVVVALAATSVKAATDCDPRVFMVQDVQAIQESGETELAFVLTATEQEFDKAKSGAGASLYGLLSLNYQEAQEKARAIAQATKFDYKSSYAASYFSQTLSPTALQAYVQCLNHDNGSPGLRLWLNADRETFLPSKPSGSERTQNCLVQSMMHHRLLMAVRWLASQTFG